MIVSGGTVKCRGATAGDPSAVAGVTQVAGTCAALADRSLTCWGSNDHGQLGTGFGPSTSVPGSLVPF